MNVKTEEKTGASNPGAREETTTQVRRVIVKDGKTYYVKEVNKKAEWAIGIFDAAGNLENNLVYAIPKTDLSNSIDWRDISAKDIIIDTAINHFMSL